MRRVLLILLTLGVIAGVLVSAELFARNYLRDQIAAGLQQEFNLRVKPTTTLEGNPLLLDLARSRITRLTATTESMPMVITNKNVWLKDVGMDARDIAIEGPLAVVGDLSATGLLDWSSLTSVAGLPVAAAGRDRLAVDYRVDLLGLGELNARVSGVPTLDVAAQTISLANSRIDISGVSLTPAMSQRILDRVVKPIPITLERGLRLSAVSVEDAGLRMSLVATGFTVRWQR